MTLAERIATEGARLAAACTACGACASACPMGGYAGIADAPAVAAGMREVLLGGRGEAALGWIAACTKSGCCTAACPEGLDAALMLRFARFRAMGALGDAPRIAVKEDTQFAPKVKAFARLTLSPREQEEWL